MEESKNSSAGGYGQSPRDNTMPSLEQSYFAHNLRIFLYIRNVRSSTKRKPAKPSKNTSRHGKIEAPTMATNLKK